MTQTTAPRPTPSPNGGDKQPVPALGNGPNPRAEFLMAALNMSWQLAFVVLVPIIGGFELDRKLKTSPVLIIIGFVIAMAGTGLVLWQALRTANRIAARRSSQ